MLLDAIATSAERVDVERFATSFTAPERALLRDAAPMRLDRACVVVAPREAEAGLVVVLEGTVAVRMNRLAAAPRLLDIAHSGYWCGRCGAIALTPSSWSVAAREATTLLYLRGDQVGTAETRDPAVSEVLARRFCERIEELDVMLAVICERRPLVKVARVLFATATRSGRQSLGPTRAEVGELTGLSGNSVGRALDQLARQGAITIGYRCLTVADGALLRRAAALRADGDGGVRAIGSAR
jgi:CRP-like cAMP-binding protein